MLRVRSSSSPALADPVPRLAGGPLPVRLPRRPSFPALVGLAPGVAVYISTSAGACRRHFNIFVDGGCCAQAAPPRPTSRRTPAFHRAAPSAS